MPIGKNSIKRVANNGCSKTKTEEVCVENSSVIANTAPEVKEMVEEMVKKPKKTETKKKPTAKKKAENKPIPTVKEDGEVEKFDYVGIGEELPVYLL